MDYQKIASEIRKKILKMIFTSKSAHIGSALSCVDILVVLYFKIMKIDPQKPLSPSRDRFILSKGHGAAALYATLAQRGFFSDKILDTYCRDGGKLPGHNTAGYVPGVETTTGSLGHGLAIGAGMAQAAKMDNKKYRIFVLMSDGEQDEGAVWEAALFASHHKLDNLVGIIDYNKIQSFGETNRVLNLEPLKEKWSSFGWGVKEIAGHNFNQIEQALKRIPFSKNKPSLIIAYTIKGKGVSFMENKLEWHYYPPSESQYQQALKELN
jgi:transketolase